MPFARSDSGGSAQTDTELVAAPGANRQVVVHSVYISSDTADTVTLESSTGNLRWRQYVAANGGSIAESERGLFRCAANESLTYTTGTTSNVFVSVRYEEARATGE